MKLFYSLKHTQIAAPDAEAKQVPSQAAVSKGGDRMFYVCSFPGGKTLWTAEVAEESCQRAKLWHEVFLDFGLVLAYLGLGCFIAINFPVYCLRKRWLWYFHTTEVLSSSAPKHRALFHSTKLNETCARVKKWGCCYRRCFPLFIISAPLPRIKSGFLIGMETLRNTIVRGTELRISSS